VDPNKAITVIVLTSPTPNDPLTKNVITTLDSVRRHLPTAQINVLADGVRREEEHRRYNYMTYLGYLATSLVARFSPAYFAVSHKHIHQIGLMRRILPAITTPLLLFMEHDTPLNELPIEWNEIVEILCDPDEEIACIRFNPEVEIPKEHEYLMCGEEMIGAVRLTKTIQFHARPHIATTLFYRRLLDKFSPDANCFIEDKAHSICQVEGWDNFPMAIYTPEGSQKRSYHLDSRNGAKKFDQEQKF
jgi:hypothetical protein